MKKVINIIHAKKLLLEREVLVYKPFNEQVTYS